MCRPNHDEVLARGLRFIEEAEDAEDGGEGEPAEYWIMNKLL